MARIFVKKRIFIEHLTFSQRQMFKLATVALAEVKDRLHRNRDVKDNVAKPLTRWYARIKQARGLNPWRDFRKSGDMLRNLQVRTVTDKRARMENSTRKGREKARALGMMSPWLLYSPHNQRRLHTVAQQILFEKPPAALVKSLSR